VEFVKIAQQELFRLYYDLYAKFEDATFNDFNVVEALANTNLPIEWFFDLNGRKDYLAFSLVCYLQVFCLLH
jgi:hypothetical protein